jgi:hypothetical protein
MTDYEFWGTLPTIRGLRINDADDESWYAGFDSTVCKKVTPL